MTGPATSAGSVGLSGAARTPSAAGTVGVSGAAAPGGAATATGGVGLGGAVTPPSLNSGLFWREDQALRKHLMGVALRDANAPAGGRQVPVYFRLPAGDARLRTFPYIIIDRLTAAFDGERAMSGRYLHVGAYRPDGYPVTAAYPAPTTFPAPNLPAGQQTAVTADEWPVPLSLVYQVSGWTRVDQHRTQLEIGMLRRLPVRYGALDMGASSHEADDMSMRRLDIIDGPHTDEPALDPDQQKRVFRTRWTVAINSEVFYSDLVSAVPVQDVDFQPSTDPRFTSIAPPG